MLFRRKKIVVATTHSDVDTAFSGPGATDEVVVEGDADLLSYAERRAGVRTPESIGGIIVQVVAGDGARAVKRQSEGSSPPIRTQATTDFWQQQPIPGAPGIASGSKSNRRALLAGTAMCTLLVLAGIFNVSWKFSSPVVNTPPSVVQPLPSPLPPPSPASQSLAVPPPQPLAQGPPPPPVEDQRAAGTSPSIVALAWPAVAIAAIVALAIIAWKAITHGQNVEFEWKVTNKVTGRLVITKVEVKRQTRRKVA
jgi:hypothetical protein